MKSKEDADYGIFQEVPFVVFHVCQGERFHFAQAFFRTFYLLLLSDLTYSGSFSRSFHKLFF